MATVETQASSKSKHSVSLTNAREVRTDPWERLRLARVQFHRFCSRSWNGKNDPLNEHYTVAEMLSLCATIFLVLGLMTLMIVYHLVQSQATADSNRTSVTQVTEEYQQDGSAESILFMDESSATHNITCSAGFYIASNVCLPACDEWEQNSHQTTVATSAILLVAALMSLISGACVIFGSIIRHDTMFHLPSVFIVYMTISYCTAQIIDSIRIIDNLTSRALFCSSRDLDDSFNHSTNYCKFLGASIQYFSISLSLWWLFHIGYLCYKLNFALFSKTKLNSTCLHIILVILGILLPLPPILIALSYEDYQYTMIQVPPVTCTSRSAEFTYFSYTLIINIILMAGVGMLLNLFWTIHKYRKCTEAQLSSAHQSSNY